MNERARPIALVGASGRVDRIGLGDERSRLRHPGPMSGDSRESRLLGSPAISIQNGRDHQLAFGSPRWTLRPDRGIPLPSREYVPGRSAERHRPDAHCRRFSTASPAVIGHRDDVRGRLGQRDVQQGRQPAARPDLGPGPLPVLGTTLGGVQAELPDVHGPDLLALPLPWQVQEEHAVESFGARELRGQPEISFAEATTKTSDSWSLQVCEQGPEHAESRRRNRPCRRRRSGPSPARRPGSRKGPSRRRSAAPGECAPPSGRSGSP